MIQIAGTHRVQIRQEDGHTCVFVDGAKLKRVREVGFHQSVEEAPTISLDIYGAPALNVDAFVEIKSSSDEYLEYLNEKIANSDSDVKYALMECRGEYMRMLGVNL